MSESKKPTVSEIRALVIRATVNDEARDKLLFEGVPHLLDLVEGLLSCGHPKACLSPITVEYRDGTLEDAQECSFCVQLKAAREKVREMCIHGIETILLRPGDNEQLVERIELGIKIRQLDLTELEKG